MWMVNKVTDRNGNYMTFEYENKNNKELVLKKIIYSGNNVANITADCEVNFYYSISNNRDAYFIAKSTLERTVILRQIESKINGVTYNNYNFNYVKNFIWDFLSSVQVSNKDGRKFNKTEFNYENDFLEEPCSTIQKKIDNTYFSLNDDGHQIISVDYNGDGLKDLVSIKNGFGGSFGWKMYENLGDGKFKQVDDFEFPDIVPGFINPSSTIGFLDNKGLMKQVVDFDGNGLEDFYMQVSFDIVTDGIPSRSIFGYIFKSNGTSMNSTLILHPNSFNPTQIQFNTFLADMNGDTRTDMVILQSLFLPQVSPPSTNIFTVKDIANGQEYTLTNNNRYDLTKAITIGRNNDGTQEIDGIIEIVTTAFSTTNQFRFLKLQGNALNIYGSINYSFNECDDQDPVIDYLGDYNGDGYTDKLRYSNNSWSQQSIIGGGTVSVSMNSAFLPPDNCNNHLFAVDVNADGKSDIVQLMKTGNTIICWPLYFINGDWISINSPITNSVNLGNFNSFDMESVSFADVDGDGTNDMIFKAENFSFESYWYVHYFKRSIAHTD